MIERPKPGSDKYRTLNQVAYSIDQLMRVADTDGRIGLHFTCNDWQLISEAIAGFLHPENVVGGSVSQSCPECERLARRFEALESAIRNIHAAAKTKEPEEALPVVIGEAMKEVSP